MIAKFISLICRLAQTPACYALFSSAHIAESLILIDGFSTILLFFLVMNMFVYFAKQHTRHNRSKKGIRNHRILLIMELVILLFSLATIVIAFWCSHAKSVHDIKYYWLLAANVIIYLVIEVLYWLVWEQEAAKYFRELGNETSGNRISKPKQANKKPRNLSPYNKPLQKNARTTKITSRRKPGNIDGSAIQT